MYFVEPTNGIELELTSLKNVIFSGGRTLIKDASQATNEPLVISDTPLPKDWQMTVVVTSDIENTLRKLDYMSACGLDTLCILPEKDRALCGSVESHNLPDDVERLNIIDLSVRFVGKGIAVGYAKEAENVTLGTGAVAAADTDASGDSCVQLNAQNEDVYFSITQSRWALPLGNYRLYVRAKDSAQVATDLSMSVYNTSDSTTIASATKTLTASYAWYSIDFTIGSTAVGDSIKFWAQKVYATANTISVDLFCVVMV